MATLFLSLVILSCAVIPIHASCSSENQCTCEFDDASTFKSKSEVLAAAVGALGPLVAVGGGFGIWKLVTGKLADSAKGMLENKSETPSKGNRGSSSPATNSTRTSSSDSRNRSTPLTLNDFDMDDELDFPDTPSPSTYDPNYAISSPKWSSGRQMPTALNNRTPLAAKPDDPNGWMF